MQRFTRSFYVAALFVLLGFSSVNLVSASPELWSRTYGDSEVEEAYCVIETSDGHFVVAGVTNYVGNDGDAWLVKTNSEGNVVWSKTFGGDELDVARCVVEASGGGYVFAGWTRSFSVSEDAFWLVKVDVDGNLLWSKTHGGSEAKGVFGLVASSDGGYAVAGVIYLRSGDGDFWLAKTDAEGNLEWDKTFSGSEFDVARSLVQAPDGGYVLAGYTNSFGAGLTDARLVKTDSEGNKVWDKTYGTEDNEGVYSVVVASDGGFALAGGTFIPSDCSFWLVKTDSEGNMDWNQKYGESGTSEAYSLVATSDGGYALCGYTDAFGAGLDDFWLVKTDNQGNMQWNQTYGDTENEAAWSLVATSDGGYALAGYKETSNNYDFALYKTDGQGIPEFPAWSMLPIMLTFSLVAFMLKRKLKKQ